MQAAMFNQAINQSINQSPDTYIFINSPRAKHFIFYLRAFYLSCLSLTIIIYICLAEMAVFSVAGYGATTSIYRIDLISEQNA